ncbi:Uncharacterized protein HZ326_6735 [Fusarium oxysporum f. sp. albedinis]|jgi:hypothetical protein|nr:Uncharacterized protein HZ326_6735 [Fusarium oxysporum f. sp. albedinis]
MIVEALGFFCLPKFCLSHETISHKGPFGACCESSGRRYATDPEVDSAVEEHIHSANKHLAFVHPYSRPTM